MAESGEDFIHKLHIALKEVEETQYWLDLLLATGFLDAKQHTSVSKDAQEVARMLTSSIKTKKLRQAKRI
jgi:four helix bundle protein